MCIVVAGSFSPSSWCQCEPLEKVLGERPRDHFGYSIDGCGDVDDDGFGDFIVGAVAAGREPGEGDGPGCAYVFSGRDYEVIFKLCGDENESGFGNNVRGAGDINRDGFSDFLIDLGGSRVRLYSGADASVLFEWQGEQSFGREMEAMGDINGDGYDDIVIADAALSEDAAVKVFSGRDGQCLLEVTHTDARLDLYFGLDVAAMGDVDADLVPDFAVSAMSLGDTYGSVFIYSGADGHEIREVSTDPKNNVWSFGYTIDSLADLDGDGVRELIVGAPGGSRDPGRALLYSGRDGTLMRTFLSINSQEYGAQVENLGDQNGDGADEIGIVERGYSNEGRVFIYDGATLHLVRTLRTERSQGGHFTIASLGDRDRDSHDDFLLAETIVDLPDREVVYIMSGACGLIRMHGVKPGIAGQLNTVRIDQVKPRRPALLVYGLAEGSTLVPGCPWDRIPIAHPVVVARGRASRDGVATFRFHVPDAASGQRVMFQAIEPERCRFSPVEEVVFK